jgi:hypothetical protein
LVACASLSATLVEWDLIAWTNHTLAIGISYKPIIVYTSFWRVSTSAGQGNLWLDTNIAFSVGYESIYCGTTYVRGHAFAVSRAPRHMPFRIAWSASPFPADMSIS